MISGKVILVRGKDAVSEDWGDYDFVAMPSPADRIMVSKDGAENYATVLAVHHYPCVAGSDSGPTAEIVAQWTGSAPRMR